MNIIFLLEQRNKHSARSFAATIIEQHHSTTLFNFAGLMIQFDRQYKSKHVGVSNQYGILWITFDIYAIKRRERTKRQIGKQSVNALGPESHRHEYCGPESFGHEPLGLEESSSLAVRTTNNNFTKQVGVVSFKQFDSH